MVEEVKKIRKWAPPLEQVSEKEFLLLEDLVWSAPRYELCVPAGFVSDLASVPWFLHFLFPPYGRYTEAAIIHDWLYSVQYCTRGEADWIMVEVMRAHIPPPYYITRASFYGAIRAFGWAYWSKHSDEQIETNRSLGGYFRRL